MCTYIQLPSMRHVSSDHVHTFVYPQPCRTWRDHTEYYIGLQCSGTYVNSHNMQANSQCESWHCCYNFNRLTTTRKLLLYPVGYIHICLVFICTMQPLRSTWSTENKLNLTSLPAQQSNTWLFVKYTMWLPCDHFG